MESWDCPLAANIMAVPRVPGLLEARAGCCTEAWNSHRSCPQSQSNNKTSEMKNSSYSGLNVLKRLLPLEAVLMIGPCCC